MGKLSAAQQRLINDAVLIAATRLLFETLRGTFPCPNLKKIVTIHNGQGLTKASRDKSGAYPVYASGGYVGQHSETLSDLPFVVIGRKGSAGKVTYAPLGGWAIDTAYFAQPNDVEDLDCKYLYYALCSLDFSDDIITTAIPGINRTSIYRYSIPVPPKSEQLDCVRFLDASATKSIRELPKQPPFLEELRHFVAQIEANAVVIDEARSLRRAATDETATLVPAQFYEFLQEYSAEVKHFPLSELVYLERRPVSCEAEKQYAEIGLYSHGKGIFHKHPRTGLEIGEKKIYWIKNGDLILQVTFAWEGAIGLAGPEEDGMCGSVRFPTFRVYEHICDTRFLLMYLRLPEGIEQLGKISPGSAGRNRVLNLKRLNEVFVPVIPLDLQHWLMDELQVRVNDMIRLQAEIAAELDALLPSILDRAFKER